MTNLKPVFNFLLLATFVVFFASGCKEDIAPSEELNNRLAGDWQVESYIINGEDLMRSEFISFEMEFNKEGAETGETEWIAVDIDGEAFQEEFDYLIKNDGQEIEFNSDGDEIELDIEINGDELEIDGFVDGDRIIIEAERD